MATSKLLQKPKIIDVVNGEIRIAHPDISGYLRTNLGAQIASGGTAMTVLDNDGFADDDWFIVGEVGDNSTEEDDVNGTPTRGTSLTVTNTLKFNHEVQAPVTKIFERKFTVYGAGTDGGTGTAIIATGSAKNIQWDKSFSTYRLISSDTTYAYYYVKFYDGTTESSASDYVATAGMAANTVERMAQSALEMTNTNIDARKITREFLVRSAQECQDAIQQFAYQDPRTGDMEHVDWDFEIDYDASLTISTNENEYSLSTLGLKYPKTDKGIINVRIGSDDPMDKLPIQEFDEEMADRLRTNSSVEATAGQTTLTVDSNVEFSDSGTLYLGSDTITYTGKSSTTGFTGIPASGTGAITATHAVDSPVWQNISPKTPTKWTMDNGTLKFNAPVESDYNSYPIKIRFYKALTALTETSDLTEVSFYNVFHQYLAYKIEQRKGDLEKAQVFKADFDKQVLQNALMQKVPTTERQSYYTFDDPFHVYDNDNDD